MCEEVRQPALQVPKAMVGTIVINLIAGLIFLVPVCFVMPGFDEFQVLNFKKKLRWVKGFRAG